MQYEGNFSLSVLPIPVSSSLHSQLPNCLLLTSTSIDMDLTKAAFLLRRFLCFSPSRCIFMLSFFIFFAFITRQKDDVNIFKSFPTSAHLTFTQDGGDCQAFNGPRRPSWADPASMRLAIPQFVSIYATRPFKNNTGGMLFDHSFALWFILNSLNPPPTTIIESGAFQGHSTWLIKRSLPDVRLISIDPSPPKRKIHGVEYMIKDKFKDFSEVNWASKGVDPKTTLVFLDDHQSGFRRAFREGHQQGFLQFIMEDNYAFLAGDNMSMKWVCERERRDEWPNEVRDNFGQIHTKQTWEEHLKLGEEAAKKTRIYYEFPPIAHQNFTKQTRYIGKYSSTPILLSNGDFDLWLRQLPLSEFGMYTHFSFLELKEDAEVHRAK